MTQTSTSARKADQLIKQYHGMTAAEWSDLHGLDCSHDEHGEVLESMTHQEFKDDCDINKILERYLKTGTLPDMIKRDPQYGDFASVPDFMKSQNIVARANEQFAGLDAHIRKRFGNDPAEFLEFVNDPKNGPEMVKLGLAKIREGQEAPAPTEPPQKTNATKKEEPASPDTTSKKAEKPAKTNTDT